MQLTKQTDFAFRTLLYLANVKDQELTRISDVCAFYDISANHIAKVVVKLGKLGYIETVRGKEGGIRLKMRPDEIDLAQVVIQFEPTLNPINCTKPPCRIMPTCKLKHMLADGMRAFLGTMKGKTLADIL